jgi:predicted alpha/beta-hydrolase family hydrolase
METNPRFEDLRLQVSPDLAVSANLGFPEWWPSGNRVGIVMAHDVGSDMENEFLVWLQRALVDRGVLAMRFNFPFAENGRKRPDADAVLDRAFRAAAAGLVSDPQNAPGQLVFGGMGLGCRVAAQMVAHGAKAEALVCLGYPLHAAGKPSQLRAEPLYRVICPTLFVQGTHDTHCRIDRLQALLRQIGAPTRLAPIEDTDHALQPIKRTARSGEEVRQEVGDVVQGFLMHVTGPF